MQLDIFKKILEVDSTSGKERGLSEFLKDYFPDLNGECVCRSFEVGDGTENLLFRWKCGDSQQDSGRLPRVVLCSHLDTVPPYIEPNVKEIRGGEALPDGNVSLNFQDTLITGRGSCDAKGQFFAMWTACEELAKELEDVRTASGYHDFGLLLLSGEETGSFGAKAFTRDCPGAEWIIVGEPTDNCMVTASKGTQAFQVTIRGKACHSGYPELGHSAVDTFVEVMNMLGNIDFPEDSQLGETTWNVGKLVSDNPQNILSPLLMFRIYFRTTFASHEKVQQLMTRIGEREDVKVEALGGDNPMSYDTFEGIDTKTVAFGSDTPRLTKFMHKSLCGPGSISVAHTPREYVLLSDLEKACRQYKSMVLNILNYK